VASDESRSTPAALLRVSVIIPVRGDPRLGACLDSLAAQSFDRRSFEVIVVGETDDAAAQRAVERVGGRYIVGSGGAYAARVAGVAQAKGEVLAFTDSDVVLPPDWIATVDAIFRDPAAEVATGPSSSVSSTPLARWIQAIDEDRWTRAAAALDHAIVETRNLAARADVLRRIPFDASFRNAGDLDLGIRLRAAGVSIRVVEALRVAHRHPESLVALVRREIRRGRGLAQLDRKHGRIERSLGERPLRIAGFDLKVRLLRLARRRGGRWLPWGLSVAAIAVLLPATWLLARLPGAAGLGRRAFTVLERSALLLGRSQAPG
jgi:glycosyltransferase involved in cell wall biosynthesis